MNKAHITQSTTYFSNNKEKSYGFAAVLPPLRYESIDNTSTTNNVNTSKRMNVLDASTVCFDML